MLHRIWQVHHKLPHEIYRLSREEKLFLFASEELAIEGEIEQQKEHDAMMNKLNTGRR